MSLEGQTSNVKPSLKETLKDHWETRDFQVSQEKANVIGVTLFLYSIVFFPIINILWLMPTMYDDWYTYGWRCLFSLFVTFESFVNWRSCVRNHDDIVLCPHCKFQGATIEKQRVLAARETGKHYCDQWKFCLYCQIDTPPRSHHCKICQVCVLKRDHHCYFTYRCIGFNTQRRFIVLCFYLCVSCCWFAYTCISYLSSTDSSQLIDYLLPVTTLKFFFFGVTLKFLFILTNLYLSIAFACLSIFFFLWEILLIVDGKTSYEAGKLINRYRQGIGNNIRSVFGNYCLIHFIWPFKTDLPVDGFNWQLNECLKVR